MVSPSLVAQTLPSTSPAARRMSEVYRAGDTKLSRDVDQVLPEAFAADADRVVRFKREAQILASLNAACCRDLGFEDAQASHFLFSSSSGVRSSPSG